MEITTCLLTPLLFAICFLNSTASASPFNLVKDEAPSSISVVLVDGADSSPTSSNEPTTSPSPTSSNTQPTPSPSTNLSCAKNYTVVFGDTCSGIASNNGITVDQILSWNPWVTGGCQLIIPGWVLCVAVPSTSTTTTFAVATEFLNASTTTAATAMVTACGKNYNVSSGDNCYGIAQSNGLTTGQIVALNPWLNGTCATLMPGYNLCLAGTTYVASAPPCITSTAAPGITSTASPGITSTASPSITSTASPSVTSTACSSIYTVAQGDYCYSIAQANGVTPNQIIALNPWLNGTCDNLLPGWNLCLAQSSSLSLTSAPTTVLASSISLLPSTVPAQGCSRSYTVLQGDYCEKIAQSMNVQVSQIVSLNPWLPEGCGLLMPGWVLCLEVTPPMTSTVA